MKYNVHRITAGYEIVSVTLFEADSIEAVVAQMKKEAPRFCWSAEPLKRDTLRCFGEDAQMFHRSHEDTYHYIVIGPAP